MECDHDILNPVRKGRARWHCPKCDADISMDVIYLAMAMEDEDAPTPGDEGRES